ncbi:DUF397 domain-containing protein [Streptomyces zinciresistens]|uniref:DUF397 domain-containing protein n=1 Tax=Streptomyces zinciresistens TaxID=1073330 RepID=UPI000996F910|nr:DUF397 domain-containing protein [Streptomyces zinciresistens]
MWNSGYSSDFEDACVEARVRPGRRGVLVRDSKDRTRQGLAISATAWSAFTSAPVESADR